MRDIEPDELSSSEWVRFLVMPENERDRWMSEFRRQRRNSDESSSSAENDRQTAYDKAEEARLEAEEARRPEQQAAASTSEAPRSLASPVGTTPAVSIWARHFADEEDAARPRPASPTYSARRPMHMRRAVTDGIIEAPPTYDSVVRATTPPACVCTK